MTTYNEIDPFDIVSGKVVQNRLGTFWFKSAGDNVTSSGYPIINNLYRENGPVIITKNGIKLCRSDKYEIFTGYLETILHTHLYYWLDKWSQTLVK